MAPRKVETPLGAYGFRLVMAGVEGPAEDLVPVGDGAPDVHVRIHHASFVEDRDEASDGLVVFGYRGGSGFIVRRDPATVEVESATMLPPAALVHPVLTVPMSVFSRWSGAVTLHAGAFETMGGAWGVIGQREAGKSTTLASMATRGCPVVADDLLVIDGVEVRAGPCCVDLRPDVAARFAGSRLVGEVGGRPRFRLSTPTGSATVPLRGFLDLAWHDESRVTIERLPTPELLKLLYAQEYIGLMGPVDPRKILDVLAVPGWKVTRPRDWSATDEVCERLLALAADHA